jgi:hypothetical protein
MGVKLIAKDRGTKIKSREEIEAANLLQDLFEHNEDRGAISTLSLGMPGSCKTAANLVFCQYAMNHYPEDKIFWRSAMNTVLQFPKISKYRIFVEKESGVVFIDRRTQKDVTGTLDVTYFSSFDELFNMCAPGVCNAVFFKDMHMRGIGPDYGTIQWFRFMRFLLGRYEWKHVFLDEYHEMVKAGASGAMWREIQEHSNDVSNARKSNLSIHGNAHQTSELDYRVLSNIMCVIQMYGSKVSGCSPVNRKGLGNLSKPNEKTGAHGWISSGGKFGRFCISEVMKSDKSIMAKVDSTQERTLRCPCCNVVFLESESFNQMFCSKACYHTHENMVSHRNRERGEHKRA